MDGAPLGEPAHNGLFRSINVETVRAPAAYQRGVARDGFRRSGVRGFARRREVPRVSLETWQDEALVEAAQERPESAGDYLEVLFRRYQRQVAAWCLRLCGNRDEAADLAQEVFLRVQSRLSTFRMDSRFSTWLYTVTRSVGINRGVSASRRKSRFIAMDDPPETADPAPGPVDDIEQSQTLSRFRRALREHLDARELQVLFLHYAHGIPLHTVTRMLGLQNKSGAKAFVVRAKRKLRGKFDGLSQIVGSREPEEP